MDRIGVLSSLSHHCAARIEALSLHLSDNNIQHIGSLIQGCENLDQGEIDLLIAPSNMVWDSKEVLSSKGLSIVAALQRNHPFHVLVSSDDPWHLKADAIILCDEKIIQRQLLRRRGKIPRRLEIRNFSQFDLDSNSGEDLRKAERMIKEGEIDGFIIPRGSYSLAGLNERRHALLPDAEEMAGMRFVPAPFVDLMVAIISMSPSGAFLRSDVCVVALVSASLRLAIISKVRP